MQQYNQFCAEQRRAGNWPMAKQDIYERAYEAGKAEAAGEIAELQAHCDQLCYRLDQAAHCIHKNMSGDVVTAFLEMVKRDMDYIQQLRTGGNDNE